MQQYQVTVDPAKLKAYGIPLMRVAEAIRNSNRDVGGRTLEMAETEYMVRGRGYLTGTGDLERVVLRANPNGTPVLLRDVAEIRLGPEMRRGIGELDGEGEAVGGVIVMRDGENARETILRVKDKLDELRASLPDGVEIVETYDRSDLIHRAIATLQRTLIEESLIVAAVCVIFLMHMRSALVAILMLPVGVLISFIAMHLLGMNSNLMSLGGIAIAIGAKQHDDLALRNLANCSEGV